MLLQGQQLRGSLHSRPLQQLLGVEALHSLQSQVAQLSKPLLLVVVLGQPLLSSLQCRPVRLLL